MQNLTLIGFGAQSKAWAANLKDRGYLIKVVLRRESPQWKLAMERGFQILPMEESEWAAQDHYALLSPDHAHREILEKLATVAFDRPLNLIYAHGFSLEKDHFQELYPHWRHLLLAPKAIASELRFQFENKGDLTAVVSTEFGSPVLGLEINQIAGDLGITRILQGTFQEETYADLFSEQSLLCSIIPYGARLAYEELVSRGISREIAYTECWKEVKLIADAMVAYGPEKFLELISPNALMGGEKGRELIFTYEVKSAFKKLADDIWSRKFFEEIEGWDFQQIRNNTINSWRNSSLIDISQGQT